MPSINGPEHMLLTQILDQQKEAREAISDIKSDMVTKGDLATVRSDLAGINTSIKDHATKLLTLENAETANTSFRKGFVNGVKYCGGAIFVAVLGIVSAIIPSYLGHQLPAGAISAQVTASPSPSPSPFKPIKIKLPVVTDSK